MLVKFVKTLLLDGFDINQFSQIFDAFSHSIKKR